MKKLICCLAFIIFFTSQAWGADCGGETPCACGDTVTSDYTLSGNLACTGTHGLVIGADNIDINLGGYTISSDETADKHGIYSEDRDNLTVTNGTIRDFDYGVVVTRADTVDLSSLTVTSNLTTGIRLNDCLTGSGSSLTVTGNGAIGVQISDGDGITFSDSTSDSNGTDNWFVHGSGVGTNGDGENTSFTDCIGSNGGTGDGFSIHENSGANHVFTRCTSHSNAARGFDLVDGSNVTLTNCETYDNTEYGIVAALSVSTVTANYWYSHGTEGALLGQAPNITVKYSKFDCTKTTGNLISTSGAATGLKLYNNTIIAQGQVDDIWRNTAAGDISAEAKNNIFAAYHASAANLYDGVTNPESEANNITFYNNLWYHPSGSATALFNIRDDAVKTFTQWAAYTIVTDTLFADPLLVASSSDDFRLQAGSPCRDAGDYNVYVDITAVTDYAGNRIRGTNVDIGAYEYQGGGARGGHGMGMGTGIGARGIASLLVPTTDLTFDGTNALTFDGINALTF